jgi:Flp pilus assembly protein TadG
MSEPVMRRPGAGFARLFSRWRAEGTAGAAAVEYALALPVFALFLYGIIELSHYMFTDISVADAARLGARYAIVRGSSSPQPASSSDIADYVKGHMPLLNPSKASISVTYNPNDNPGSEVTVQVSYPFIPFLPGFKFLKSSTVIGSSELTIYQ